MQKQFIQYINQQQLFSDTDTLLVALSGGADSVVLLNLLVKCNYKVAVAHCNFNLRGSESDADEQFVKQLVEDLNVPAHFISFETEVYAKQNKLSIEMAARELRYSWFNKILSENTYNYIATGHHLNDSIETVFLNLARSTGYNGLTGISAKNGNIVRPLLFATRQQIENYAIENNLSYRNDSSNESDKYLRNIVRNTIVPAFKKMNPAFEQVMSNNLNHLSEAASVLDQYFKNHESQVFEADNNQIKLSFSKLLNHVPLKIHLYQLIKDYGFNNDAVTKIEAAINKTPGKMFYSNTHCLLIDRDSLIISENKTEKKNSCIINNINEFEGLPIKVKASLKASSDFKIIKNNSFASIDLSKVQFPLTLRNWEQGDYFYPLGMTQKKKVSDFLIDTKVNRFDKENTWVLTANNEIVWLVNKRLDNRFKVTESTNEILVLEFLS